jgi:hypothetical protein
VHRDIRVFSKIKQKFLNTYEILLCTNFFFILTSF